MPPKKQSAGSKKPSNSSETPSQSSKSTGKAKGSDNASTAADTSKGKSRSGNTTPLPVGAELKTPSVSEIIGGKSWTGKLPQTLFYEHCVKCGWTKPIYDMRKERPGFIATVSFGQKNSKTNEVETVSLKPSADLNPHQPTALEARHYCATYALHRVCNMKNVHMALPPTHRDFWSKLEETRKAEAKTGRAWKYEADPFTAKREREATLEASQKRKEAAAAAVESGKQSSMQALDPKSQRGWKRVPQVDMSRDRRREVEDLIKRHHQWNPAGIELDSEQKKAIVNEMAELGFRKIHVEEALEWVKDQEEALEWLLIHVPEDDMPPRFLPENYAAGFSFQSGDTALQQEYAAKRLAASGYSIDLCRDALKKNCGSEDRAAEALMQMLLYGSQRSPAGPLEENLITFEPYRAGTNAEDWEQERGTLAAIFGDDRFKQVSPTVCRILLEQRTPSPDLPEKVYLEVRKPCEYDGCKYYPDTIPTIAVITDGEPRVPSHVKLSIIRKTAQKAEEMIGEQMIYSLVDWLEGEIANIVERPGPLREVSSAVTGSDETDEKPTPKRSQRGKKGRQSSAINWTPGNRTSLEMFSRTQQRLKTPQQVKMIAARQRLPAWNLRDHIVQAVNEAPVTIISGETGSGKSTQAVQFILDDLIHRELGDCANIICTQPRRISALGLADRVSDERCCAVGQEVGYAIRGESRQTRGVTRITFVTTGVLLRRLQMGDTLQDVSHIFVDEVHERSLDTDFLLILLRRMLSHRQDLKVILMSATLDAEMFAEYFGGEESVRMINIEGRTFPVTDLYLDTVIQRTGFDGGGRIAARVKPKHFNWADTDEEDDDDAAADEEVGRIEPAVNLIIQGLGSRINYNLIAATVMHIDKSLGDMQGGILIFLPGTMEIQRCIDAIKTLPGGATKYHALPLHASLISSDQRRVFPPAPKGQRKVIAATNVAETSITIEDIVAVIDTGRVKETSYDAMSNVVKLEETWASRAAAKQRRGRAGRVRAGTCYKLYTRQAEKNKMAERPQPELLRVPLEQTCLAMKAMGVKDVKNFLASALTPPPSTAVEGALWLLEKMGATVDDELTALGRHMAMIPADLKCSKLMVFGAMFGCLEAAVVIASILTAKSPFVRPPRPKDADATAARAQFAQGQGDLLADFRAWDAWMQMRNGVAVREVRKWCDERFLSHQTLLDITSNRRQYLDSLKDVGFLPLRLSQGDPAWNVMNRNSSNDVMVRALMAASFTPQIARIVLPEQKFLASSTGTMAVDAEARQITYHTNENGRVFINPGSTVFEMQSFPGGAGFLAYFTKMETAKVYLRDCTPVNSFSLLLFGGKVEVDTLGRGITVDGWLRLRGWGRIGILVQRLRAMLDAELAKMVDDPDAGTALLAKENEVVKCVQKLIEGNGE